MTKTVSVRIDNETHTKLVDGCNIIGQSMNEMLKGLIDGYIPCLEDNIKEIKNENQKKTILIENV